MYHTPHADGVLTNASLTHLVSNLSPRYDMSDLSNQYAHLTNTSINKASPNIDDDRGFVGAGCKRTFAELRKYALFTALRG